MKLDIIGSVASGKTTLARKLSAQYQIPFYEKDNIVWERTPHGDKRRNPEERDIYNSRPTLRFLYANILWVGEFNQKRTQIISSLSAYGEKWKRFTDEEAVLDFVAEKYGQGEK